MLNASSRQWSRWLIGTGLALVGWALFPLMVWAQAISPAIRDFFLADPEFAEPRDPLLPTFPVSRPLSPLEKFDLEIALDELAAKAERHYLEGEIELAFQEWMREVRLRRILGYPDEIQAMQRVGLRAWENARTQETQLLTLRLRQIQADLLSQESLNNRLLEGVAAVFEVLRDIDAAIAVYETLIVRAAQAGNRTERQRLLENLANLQETWFRFEVAGKTYQSLLASIATSENDPLRRVQYLQGAIRNYQDAGQLQTTINYQRRLLRQYEETAQIQGIPALMLAIARNYRDLEDVSQASNYYQATYATALVQNQSSIARDAIQDLASIYLSLERPDDVLYLYEQQIAVERLSYNGYGLMQVFDQLGQLHETLADPEAAILAYQEGLILAEHLGYRAAYFKNRLQRLFWQQGTLTVVPAEQHQSSRVGPLAAPNVWEGN
ncbi:MAG: hypothetical protein F6K42_35590 [Leptolyngbya sp. SIO1D8]|nr:hypothetical protein [Leptolyngbya sp. SIO1D8]